MTFLWRPMFKHFGKEKQILAGVTLHDYELPPGFKVDERRMDDDPIQADTTLDDYNAEAKAVSLINLAT